MSSFRSIQVVNVRWFNATAWYGLELARLLNAAGHESRVVALADTETFAKAEEMGLRPLAMPLNAKNPLEFPGLIRDMGRLVRAFRPDVVNCHRGESFLFWGLLKGMGRIRACPHARGSAAAQGEPPQPNFTYAGG